MSTSCLEVVQWRTNITDKEYRTDRQENKLGRLLDCSAEELAFRLQFTQNYIYDTKYSLMTYLHCIVTVQRAIFRQLLHHHDTHGSHHCEMPAFWQRKWLLTWCLLHKPMYREATVCVYVCASLAIVYRDAKNTEDKNAAVFRPNLHKF